MVTNSLTRPDSVFSTALKFAVAPLSTSCRSTLASRSRSNNAVVSLRSMLWVSMTSDTAAVAVWCDCSVAVLALACRSSSERVTELEALDAASLMTRAISWLFSSIVFVKFRPLASIVCTVSLVMRSTSAANC